MAIDRSFGFIRSWAATSAVRHDRGDLREIITTNNTASDVWADAAYRSKTDEAWLRDHSLANQIHHEKLPPPRRPLSGAATRPSRRFARWSSMSLDRMDPLIHAISLERAKTKISLVNIATTRDA